MSSFEGSFSALSSRIIRRPSGAVGNSTFFFFFNSRFNWFEFSTGFLAANNYNHWRGEYSCLKRSRITYVQPKEYQVRFSTLSAGFRFKIEHLLSIVYIFWKSRSPSTGIHGHLNRIPIICTLLKNHVHLPLAQPALNTKYFASTVCT